MPGRCPHCGEVISALNLFEKYESESEVLIHDGEVATIHLMDFSLDPDYECTECQEVLFHSESEAIKFLRGEGNDSAIRQPDTSVETPGCVSGKTEETEEETVGPA